MRIRASSASRRAGAGRGLAERRAGSRRTVRALTSRAARARGGCRPRRQAAAVHAALALGLHLDQLQQARRRWPRPGPTALPGARRPHRRPEPVSPSTTPAAPDLQALAPERGVGPADAHRRCSSTAGRVQSSAQLGRGRSCRRRWARPSAARPGPEPGRQGVHAAGRSRPRPGGPAARRPSRPDRSSSSASARTPPVSRPSSTSIRHTPVRASPARMARSTGAAPRHRGSREKCRLTMGSASSTWGLMIRPKATTTPRSAPTSSTSSTRLVTGRPSSRAAALTGLGVKAAAPPPAGVGPAHHQGDLEAGLVQRPQRRHGHLGRAEEDQRGWAGEGDRGQAGCFSASRAGGEGRSGSGSARAHLAQGPLGLLALVLVEVLEQQHAVEVVELVLEQPGLELVGLDLDLVAVEVVAGEQHLLGAHDLPAQAGHRQAALEVGPLAAGLGDGRVDDARWGRRRCRRRTTASAPRPGGRPGRRRGRRTAWPSMSSARRAMAPSMSVISAARCLSTGSPKTRMV